MPLIPDVSIAAAWVLPDERTAYSDQVLGQVELPFPHSLSTRMRPPWVSTSILVM